MHLRIGWLFPELMSTYGDRGNLLCLEKRAEDRGISVEILPIRSSEDSSWIGSVDLLFGGGAQNRQQVRVLQLLHGALAEALLAALHQDTPALLVCGAMQLFGKSFHLDQAYEGLGFFDCTTRAGKKRLVGPLEVECTAPCLKGLPHLIGFENHAGYTYLGNVEPLGKVVKGFGNNGKDQTEGVVYKKAIGTYAHGPLLPKNPQLADWLLEQALGQPLPPLEGPYVEKARLGVKPAIATYRLPRR